MADFRERYRSIRLVADRTTVNPLLEPEARVRVRVEGILPDGTARPIADEHVAYSVTTLDTSGGAAVARMERKGELIPLEGGVAAVRAEVLSNGTLLADTARITVRPFHREHHQALSMKFFLAMEEASVGSLAPGVDVSRLMTFEGALEVIRGMDELTRGLPKIVYLVGWQKGGHDHRYPAWDEVNPRLKRAADATAVESLRWLIRDGAKHNTSVSLHINQNDAYRDSPLFDEYDRLGLIARRRDGSYVTYDSYAGKRMYAVSHKREWDAGYAQKRIDGLLRMLPELVDTHVIHVDNYVAKIHGTDEPLDAFHGVTVEQEQEAMRAEFRYWRGKGLDVTSEGSYHGRWDPMIGLQPMTWWDLAFDPMEIPASLYCGGRAGRLPGDARFGDSMQAEDLLLRNASHGADPLTGFADEFCTTTLPWVYLNRLDRLAFDGSTVRYSDGVSATVRNGWPSITRGAMVIRYANTVWVPVTWKAKRELIVYSDISVHLSNALPEEWGGVRAVDLYRLTARGPVAKEKARAVESGKLTTGISGREPTLIVPAGEPA